MLIASLFLLGLIGTETGRIVSFSLISLLVNPSVSFFIIVLGLSYLRS